MAGKYVSGVLDPESALHERLNEVAPCAEDAYHRAQPEHLPYVHTPEILGEAEGEHAGCNEAEEQAAEKAFP